MSRPPILCKRDNHRVWTSGGLGNRLRVWTLDAYLASSFGGRVTLRYLGGAGGGPCLYDLRRGDVPGAVDRLLREGWRRELLTVNEGAPDDAILVQGEYLNDVLPGAVEGFAFSRVRLKMRDALRESREEWTGLRGRFLLRSLMTPSSWADYDALLSLYPGHVLEVSVYSRNLGDRPGRNALVWEVRRY